MKIIAIRYTSRSADLVGFYAALGFPVDVESRTGDWIELASSSAAIAVHTAEPDEPNSAPGSTELAFEADEPLEVVRSRLTQAGFPGAVIVDEAYGRSLRILDPDGVAVHVNDFDRQLYT
ncbi:MAG TPA: VOC family protein [Lacisediminihabitans sp.]|uniref:VOC family protein n=1 Tax=Lacisediminihabitans sp. TaxID=2787631 RepID=UPI002EDB30C9